MKRNILILASVSAAAVAALLCPPAGAQTDPRTEKIIKAVLETTSKEIGSEASSAPTAPVKARSYTTTEKQDDGKGKAPAKVSVQTSGKKPAQASAPAPESRKPAQESAGSAPRPSGPPKARIDTVYLSTAFTTHLIFSTDISYADLSNQTDVAGKIVEESRNKLALKARHPFTTTASISVEEGNGSFHTYILKYRERPRLLVIDTRGAADPAALARLDTVCVSTLYTTHLIFASDVIYADISRPADLTGRLVDQGRNKLAAKARAPFVGCGSMTVEEANGVFHTYIVRYEEHPSVLVKDTREEGKPVAGSLAGTTMRGTTTGSYLRDSASETFDGTCGSQGRSRKYDAPMLSEVIELKQGLYHISAKKYDIRFTCENIFSYSDMTYMTFRLDNRSGISYDVSDATFVLESTNGNKRKIVYEQNIFPKNRFGSLTAAADGVAKICYSFDKMALSSDQILKVYLYEKNGQRNIELSISYKDVNGAVAPKADSK